MIGGLTETVGADDVQVRPLDRNQLRLTLSNCHGTTDFDLSRTAIQDAVRRMLAFVSAGAQAQCIDWNRELDLLSIGAADGGEHTMRDFNWPDPPKK